MALYPRVRITRSSKAILLFSAAFLGCDSCGKVVDVCGTGIVGPNWIDQDCINRAVAKVTALYGEDSEEQAEFCAGLRRALPDPPKISSDDDDDSNDMEAWTTAKATLVKRYGEPPEKSDGDPQGEQTFRTEFRSIDESAPCGRDGDIVVACASGASFPAGDFFLASNIFEGDIPLDDPTWLYTYAFVFDQDGDPTNNWVPLPQFPNDFFQDTDRWYQLQYTPGMGWWLEVQVADEAGNITPVASDARVVIDGNTVTAYIPAAEFSDPCPDYRMTSFGHTGDFGLGDPRVWTADVEPVIEEGLAASECG